MGRTTRSRGSNDYGLRPVKKIELSEKNIKLRIIVVIVALVVGAFFIGLGVRSCTAAQSGWQAIASNDASQSVASSFSLMYNVGQSGMDATAERRAIAAIYTDAAAKAYRMFDVYSDGGALEKINSGVGKVIEVLPELYSAFEKMISRGGRALYYAPYFEFYEQIYSSEFDYEAAMFDPAMSDDVAAVFEKLSSYVSDPDAVSLKLLGDNKVELYVSDEYAAFAKENDVSFFVGFSWFEESFCADYIAQKLRDGGFTYGYIIGKNGSFINLDNSGNSYSYSLYGGQGSDAYIVCRAQFSRAVCGVYYRGFSLDGDFHFYTYENGKTVTPYIDELGRSRAASNFLFAYSYNGGCADAALSSYSEFTKDGIDKEKLSSLSDAGVESVFLDGNKILASEDGITLYDIIKIGGKTLEVESF